VIDPEPAASHWWGRGAAPDQTNKRMRRRCHARGRHDGHSQPYAEAPSLRDQSLRRWRISARMAFIAHQRLSANLEKMPRNGFWKHCNPDSPRPSPRAAIGLVIQASPNGGKILPSVSRNVRISAHDRAVRSYSAAPAE